MALVVRQQCANDTSEVSLTGEGLNCPFRRVKPMFCDLTLISGRQQAIDSCRIFHSGHNVEYMPRTFTYIAIYMAINRRNARKTHVCARLRRKRRKEGRGRKVNETSTDASDLVATQAKRICVRGALVLINY